jgi:excisionase family DNA binding protein
MAFRYNEEKYLSIEELQDVLPIHPKTLSKMLKNGSIPGAGKIGKQWYLPESRLCEYLQQVFTA